MGIAAYGAISYWGGPFIGRMIAYLPARLLPFIFLTAVAAAYSSRASITDVMIALLFGIIGYAMRRTEFSTAAFVLAQCGARHRRSIPSGDALSDDGMMIFVKEPVALTFDRRLWRKIFRSVTIPVRRKHKWGRLENSNASGRALLMALVHNNLPAMVRRMVMMLVTTLFRRHAIHDQVAGRRWRRAHASV